MTVFDSRNKRPLWAATESVKFAMKEKGKENNLVDASERLASKFHQRLEIRGRRYEGAHLSIQTREACNL